MRALLVVCLFPILVRGDDFPDPIENLIPTYGEDLLPGYSQLAPVMSGIDMLRMAVPGTPGEDYPIYAEVPATGFSCEGRMEGGYYADTEAECQPFHICTANGQGGLAKYSFLCPNGTLFNQEYFVCEYWFNVDCSKAESFYSLNAEIGETTAGAASSPVGGFASPGAGYNSPAGGSASSPASSESYGAPSNSPVDSYTPSASSQAQYNSPSASTGYAAPQGGSGGRTGRQKGGNQVAEPARGGRTQQRPQSSRFEPRPQPARKEKARPDRPRGGRTQSQKQPVPSPQRFNSGIRNENNPRANNPGRGGRQNFNSNPAPLANYGSAPVAPSDSYGASAPSGNYQPAPTTPSDNFGVAAAPFDNYNASPAAPADSYDSAAPSDSYGAAPAAPSNSYNSAPAAPSTPDEGYAVSSPDSFGDYEYEEEPLPTYKGSSSSFSGYTAPIISDASGYQEEEEEDPLPTYNRASSGSGSSYSAPGAANSLYGAPSDSGYGAPAAPSDSGYGAPPAPSDSGYGAPAAPSDSGYGAPSAPSDSGYGAPSSGSSFSAPVASNSGFGASTPNTGYGAPPPPVGAPGAGSNSNYRAPSGSPSSTPNTGYGAPPPLSSPSSFSTSANSGSAAISAQDSYGVPAADPTYNPAPAEEDRLPVYYKSEINLGLSDPNDVARVEPFLADYGGQKAAASEPEQTYGVPAAPLITLSDYNIPEVSDKGFKGISSGSYGR